MSPESPAKIRPALDALAAGLADALRALAADGHAEEANRLAGRAYVVLRQCPETKSMEDGHEAP